MILMDKRTPPSGAYVKGVGQGRRRRVLVESFSRKDLKCVICCPSSVVRRPSSVFRRPSSVVHRHPLSVVHCMLSVPIQFPRKYFSTSHEYFFCTYISFYYYYVNSVQVLFNENYKFISTFYCTYISFFCI